MSEQPDGFLDSKSAFNFNREQTERYRAEPINSAKFFAWQRDHMYKSTYAHHHSPVIVLLYRIVCCPRIPSFLVILDLFLRDGQIVYTLKVTP